MAPRGGGAIVRRLGRLISFHRAAVFSIEGGDLDAGGGQRTISTLVRAPFSCAAPAFFLSGVPLARWQLIMAASSFVVRFIARGIVGHDRQLVGEGRRGGGICRAGRGGRTVRAHDLQADGTARNRRRARRRPDGDIGGGVGAWHSSRDFKGLDNPRRSPALTEFFNNLDFSMEGRTR